MDKCPTELHSYIFELASTADNGNTYRSLSQLNTYFSSVARPCRFHSISLHITSLSPISHLLDILECTPERMRRVRHLFLSVPSTPNVIEDNQLAKSIMRLIKLASPTLYTLTFHPPLSLSTSFLSHIFSPHLTFPFLTSLSIHGYYPFPSSSCRMPRLRQLSLEGNRSPSGLLQFSSLPTAFPELTSLRIGSLSASVSFVSELEDALGFGFGCGYDFFSSPGASLLPPKLELLIIQPGKELEDCPATGRMRSKDELMMQRLHGLRSIMDLSAKEDKDDHIRLRLLERSTGPESERSAGKMRWIEDICSRGGGVGF